MLWTSGLESHVTKSGKQYSQCVTLEKWFNLVRVSVLIDSFITIIIPFVVISTMNFMIAMKLMKLYKLAKYLSISENRKSISTTNNHPMTNFEMKISAHGKTSNVIELEAFADSTIVPILSRGQKRLAKYVRSTRILFIISIVFLVLNAPIAVCKIRYSYQAIYLLMMPEDESMAHMKIEPFEETLERVTCYLYYMNFSFNFIFYFLGFRKHKV